MTEMEVAEAMQAMMAAETDKKLAHFRPTTSSGFGGAVKRVVAHLTEAPANWYGSVPQFADGSPRS